jgi:hypothetical protein
VWSGPDRTPRAGPGIEQRERAVKIVLDRLDGYQSAYAACQALAPKRLRTDGQLMMPTGVATEATPVPRHRPIRRRTVAR